INIANSASANENLNWSASVTTDAADYSLTAPLSGTLAPGANTNVTVTFDPMTKGTHNGVVTVSSNNTDAFTASTAVNTTGVGTDKEISLAPTSFNYGNVAIPGNSANHAFTVTNNGVGQNLSVSRLQITGTDATRFAFTSNGCSGQDCMPGSPFLVAPG